MKSISKYLKRAVVGLLFSVFIGTISSCDTISNDTDNVSEDIRLVNEFIAVYNDYYYLWRDKVNSVGKPQSYVADPFKLFDDLLYKEEDLWSYLTDDAEALFNEYNGVESGYGYRLVIYKSSSSNRFFAVVKAVYPDSPASQAGLKRGDIILKIDGGEITEENYLKLYYSQSIRLVLGVYDAESNNIGELPGECAMSAVQMEIDGLCATSIIEYSGRKVGYICYTDFVEPSHKVLSNICSDFRNNGVSEVILDLRYNPGGAAESAAYLASLFVPKREIEKKSVFLNQIWNSNLTKYLKEEGIPLYTPFSASAEPYNLNLERIYILTTSGTASASEAVIVGLEPYMDVVVIGEKTHGKYCGALLLQPMNNKGEVIEMIDNWAMSLVVYKFANKDGYTSFIGGLLPDFEMEDDPFSTLPLGDMRDPYIQLALADILGESPLSVGVTDVKSGEGSSDLRIPFVAAEKLNRTLDGPKGGFLSRASE